MSESIETQRLLQRLVSIGIAFSRKGPKEPADIEQTILDALPVLRQDLKLLNLVLTWAWEMGDLVHIERLKSLIKNTDPIDLAFLGGIAEYIQNQFKNWALISTHVRKRIPKNFVYRLPEKMTLAIDHGQAAPEPAFLKFGFTLPEIKLSNRKKLIPREYLVEDNLRLRFRALFGTNWRADIAFLMSQEKQINAFQISKTLRCSYETAHRIKKSLDESKFQMTSIK